MTEYGTEVKIDLSYLTPRESEVWRAFSFDRCASDVAMILGISTSSVNKHRDRIALKFGLSTQNVQECARRHRSVFGYQNKIMVSY